MPSLFDTPLGIFLWRKKMDEQVSKNYPEIQDPVGHEYSELDPFEDAVRVAEEFLESLEQVKDFVEFRDLLDRARLSQHEKDVLMLCGVEGLTPKEVAQQLSIDIRSVSRNLSSARRKLSLAAESENGPGKQEREMRTWTDQVIQQFGKAISAIDKLSDQVAELQKQVSSIKPQKDEVGLIHVNEEPRKISFREYMGAIWW
jgi:predicted DNA-binding protein (UPF0251 family)